MPRSLESLFGKLITITSECERQEYLRQACGDDESLRLQLERLLAAHFGAGSFLDPEDEATEDFQHQKLIGTLVGPYKLLEQIAWLRSTRPLKTWSNRCPTRPRF